MAVDVTHYLRRKLVSSSTAEIHTVLSDLQYGLARNEQSIILWQVHTMWVSSSSPPLASAQQEPHVHLSSCAFLNPLLPFGWIVSPCSHTKNTVQDSICLKVFSRYETPSAADTQLSAPRFLPLCEHHRLTTLKIIRTINSLPMKRDINKKNYFPGYFNRWDQVLFEIEN